MHREPDVGLDPGSPGSRPGPKAGAKPLRHPGIPNFSFFKDLFIYLRERESMSRRGERETESQADSALSTEPDVGLDLMTLRSRPEPKARVRCLTVPPKCPNPQNFLVRVKPENYWIYFKFFFFR